MRNSPTRMFHLRRDRSAQPRNHESLQMPERHLDIGGIAFPSRKKSQQLPCAQRVRHCAETEMQPPQQLGLRQFRQRAPEGANKTQRHRLEMILEDLLYEFTRLAVQAP